MKFCYNTSYALPKQPKDLDLFYKMDLGFWDCFGMKKTPSYNQRNTVEAVAQILYRSQVVSFLLNSCYKSLHRKGFRRYILRSFLACLYNSTRSYCSYRDIGLSFSIGVGVAMASDSKVLQ